MPILASSKLVDVNSTLERQRTDIIPSAYVVRDQTVGASYFCNDDRATRYDETMDSIVRSAIKPTPARAFARTRVCSRSDVVETERALLLYKIQRCARTFINIKCVSHYFMLYFVDYSVETCMNKFDYEALSNDI